MLFIRRTDCSLISDDCCLKYNSGRTALSLESGAAHLAYSSILAADSPSTLGCLLPLVPLESYLVSLSGK